MAYLRIGSHMSIAGGFSKAVKESFEIGANTFQFFTRNPRGGKAGALSDTDIQQMHRLIDAYGFSDILAHAPYTINPASAKPQIRKNAKDLMQADMKRLNALCCRFYNIHPGNHTGIGTEKGIENVSSLINEVLREQDSIMILLETMSGKGTQIGTKFEELREIIDRCEQKDKIGVCMDTCHVYCAGYDIVENLDSVMTDFDRIIGLERLKAVHLNDSKAGYQSGKDMHQKIGKGFIGKEGIVRFMNHEAVKNLPMFLETPNDRNGHSAEIAFLRENYLW